MIQNRTEGWQIYDLLLGTPVRGQESPLLSKKGLTFREQDERKVLPRACCVKVAMNASSATPLLRQN
jgi:hypothetical protein